VTEFVKTLPERYPEKKTIIACPIGFMLENMELLHDLDLELRGQCESLGLNYDRTLPVSGHCKAIAMIRELVAEVDSPLVPRRSLG
jgi:ferrochelatase